MQKEGGLTRRPSIIAIRLSKGITLSVEKQRTKKRPPEYQPPRAGACYEVKIVAGLGHLGQIMLAFDFQHDGSQYE